MRDNRIMELSVMICGYSCACCKLTALETPEYIDTRQVNVEEVVTPISSPTLLQSCRNQRGPYKNVPRFSPAGLMLIHMYLYSSVAVLLSQYCTIEIVPYG
jgi:hypothetical protein